MQKSKIRELQKALYKLYPNEDLELRLKEFFSLIGEEDLMWIEWEGEIYFYVSSLCAALGKHKSDYSANYHYRGKSRALEGKGFQLKEHGHSNRIKAVFKARYPKSSIGLVSHIVDWHRAYDYASRISNGLINRSVAEREPLGVIFNDGALYLDTQLVSERLNIEHESLLALMEKYKYQIEELGKLEERKTNAVTSEGKPYTIRSYLLNEDHAYFIGALARNTEYAVSFKYWLVKQFHKAREIVHYEQSNLDTEEIIHRQLCELTMYTSLKVQSEYPLEMLELGGLKKTVKRIDILINGNVGVELKKVRITNEIVMEVIGDRGYYHTLKKMNGFKYLVLSSPVGMTPSAEKMLEVMSPRVIFLYPHQIGEQLAKQALKEYPVEAHWWLKKMVFPKYNKVLSKEFLEVFLEKPTYVTQA
jgi:phage regulator Rha-like protein